MKLITYLSGDTLYKATRTPRPGLGRGGILLKDHVYDLEEFARWARAHKGLSLTHEPITLLDFVALDADQRAALGALSAELPGSDLQARAQVQLRAPIELPTSVRDFYAFEQHVKTARANRGLGMIPEWYNFPVFYFSNHHAICGPEDDIPYPRRSAALDFELEIACVIGRAGRDIPAEQAGAFIAGYMIMNDWSARDLQMEEMKLNMGPAKGKDFATSLGPWLVTPDELIERRVGEGAGERYDLAMLARLNGREVSRGNFKDIYFSFAQLIERASLNAWLVPGDVIGSGTVGTGCLLEQEKTRERWLSPGDSIELEIEHLGILRNRIIE